MKSFVAMRHGWMQLDFYHSTSFEIIRDHSTSFDIIRHIRHHSTDLSCLCPSELSFGCNAFSSTYPHTSLDIGVCKDTGTVTLNLTPSQFLPCEVGRGNMCKNN